MVATPISYSEAGMAVFQNEQFTSVELWAGEAPPPATRDIFIDASAIVGGDLPLGAVVGRNAAGNFVLAQTSGTAVIPIGVLAATVKQGATNLNGQIFSSGCFNMDALTWHADYSTDALKRRAFEAGFAGAAILVKKPNYSGVFF